MLSIFLFLALFVVGKTIVVKDSFRFCDDTNMPNVFLDIENSCGNTKTKHFMDYEKNVEQKFILLTKQKHLIHGLAHECRKEIIEYDSEEQISLFTTKKKIQTVKLLKTECEYMVKYKKCDDYAMECEGDFCFYESKKLNENSWDFESKKKSVRCTVSTRVLNVDSANEPMFQNSINECLFLQGFCELNDSVFVWSPDKIRHCPYDVVDEISLFQAEDNVYHSREKKIAFKLTGLIFACETSVLTTQEGFFLISSNHSIVQFPKSKDKNSILNNLKMTDFEFNNYLEMKEYDPNLKKLCLSTLNLMKSSGRANKDFLIVTDFRGNELILINEFGTLLIPQCIAVREIRIYNTSNCYQDIPISFILQDKRFDGFLTHNNILKRTSELVDCNKMSDRFYHLKLSNFSLRQIGNKVLAVNKFNQIRKSTNIFNTDISKLNYAHQNLIQNGIDYLKSANYLTHLQEIEGKFLVENKIFEKKSNSKIYSMLQFFEFDGIKGKESLIIGILICLNILYLILFIFFLKRS